MRGTELKAWRERRKLSQCDLAALLDVSRNAVIASERHDLPIDREMSTRLHRLLERGGFGYLADAYDQDGGLCGVSAICLIDGQVRSLTLPLTLLERLDPGARDNLAATCRAYRDRLVSSLQGCAALRACSPDTVFELAPGDLLIEPSSMAVVRPSQAHRTPWRLLAVLGPAPASMPTHGAAAD